MNTLYFALENVLYCDSARELNVGDAGRHQREP